ncbi:MAG: tripartite tricarboxylate transporter TctB family protein [Alphaproteobacteria bacterium]
MALDRWIALIILGFCLVYGYTAWFTMDADLAPFMKRYPIWPSTFPKVLSILGMMASFVILFGLEKSGLAEEKAADIDYRRLTEYKLGQAVILLALMVAYAICLRPLGFILSTTAFLVLGSFTLGERKWHIMLPVSLIATVGVWYLVQQVLGIYLRPMPGILTTIGAN